MKAAPYVVYIVTMVVLASGCGAAPAPAATPTSLGFGPAPWQTESASSYEWLDANGTQIGTSEYSLSLNQGAWAIDEQDLISGVEQSIQMRISAQTLAPLSEQKTIKTANNTVQLETEYAKGKLTISANVDGNSRSASLDVPANAIDNDQLLMTLRALPFAEGYSVQYVVVVAQNALKVDTTFTVQATETVTVPAGRFESWRVEIRAGQTQQTAWYQVAAPHMLVQYDNGNTRMVLSGSS
jgi:hypothetical protein